MEELGGPITTDFEPPPFRCLRDLLALRAERLPDAVVAPGYAFLTYAELHRRVEETVRCLNGLGVGRNDRAAVVLPNGPEMAAAFLGSSRGHGAPLNPAYNRSEFDFYLRDLGARALVVRAGDESAGHAAARELGVPLDGE